MARLSDDEIGDRLSGWRREGDQIGRDFEQRATINGLGSRRADC